MNISFLNYYSHARYSLASILVQNFVFCTLIAVLLWKLMPGMEQYGFWSNWLYSLLIGNCVCLLVIATTHGYRRFEFKNPAVLMLAIVAVSVIGAIIGSTLADVIVSHFFELQEADDHASGIGLSVLIALVATFSFIAFIGHKKHILQLQLTASEESRRADKARHAMLQAQLEPHMLFNTLANLRALIGTDPDKAILMLDRLDSFLRETLSSSQSYSHSLEHEFQVLEDYLTLMQIRLSDRLEYTLTLPNECKSRLIPSLLLQPLVENAIKHGIEPEVAGGKIFVNAECNQDNTVLTITDTGVGMDANKFNASWLYDESTPASGFGLANLRQRLLQPYGNDATLHVEPFNTQDGTGTKITLSLPPLSDEPVS